MEKGEDDKHNKYSLAFSHKPAPCTSEGFDLGVKDFGLSGIPLGLRFKFPSM